MLPLHRCKIRSERIVADGTVVAIVGTGIEQRPTIRKLNLAQLLKPIHRIRVTVLLLLWLRTIMMMLMLHLVLITIVTVMVLMVLLMMLLLLLLLVLLLLLLLLLLLPLAQYASVRCMGG
uniref:Uncharacterized protein n=1 Tax=Anopheles melas TaxID=34690 RepID=A0A182UJL6_9DIPT